MKKVSYGQTGLLVSRLNYGCGLMGRLRYQLTPEQGGDLLRQAFDLGINFWDTADGYGTHPHVAAALLQVPREQVVVSTKTKAKDRAGAADDVERFRRELGVDQLDVVLLHGVMSRDELAARSGAWEALQDAQTRGLIRAIGLSTHIATGEIMDALAERPDIQVVLTTCNLDGSKLVGNIESHRQQIRRLHEQGKAICLMKVLGQDMLADRAEEAISYAVQFPYAHSATIGFRDMHQVKFAASVYENR
ncbi:MAG TPA: aldo/keto reductase, partial [Chloroflexota bacterium]|nr:aldo/keto reductase [Chloroflexota bacterium]